MKVTLPILLAFASVVMASPLEVPAPDYALDEAGMEFIGPVRPGGPDVTLYGTAESIYAQILKLNPKYDVWDFPEAVADFKTKGITKASFGARNFSPNPAARNVLEERAGRYNCGVRKEIGNVGTQCLEGWLYLDRLGRGRCGAKPKKCNRVSCANHCGMFYCNKTDKTIYAYCNDIGRDTLNIVKECGRDWAGRAVSARGRMHFNDHNVELGQENC